MTKETPRNLLVTSAYLSDKPYEVQLEVLRWMRILLHDVVDRAASTASTSFKRSDDQQEEPVISRQEVEGEIHLGNDKDSCQSSSSVLEGSAVESEPSSQQSSAQDSGVATSNTTAESGLTTEDSCKSSRRKRPRKPQKPREGNALVVGSVAECFHPVSSILSTLE